MKRAGAFAFALTWLYGSLGCAPVDERVAANDHVASLNLVTAENIRAHVAYLANDALEGRRAGKPGYNAAAAYVANEFEELGLTAGGDDGWYQSVGLQQYTLESAGTSFVIHRGGNDIKLTYRDDFGMSADEVRSATGVTAGVAYVGFGVHAPAHGYSDYDGIEVDGKIVAFFRGAPKSIPEEARGHHRSIRTKEAEAVRRGAVGIIVLRSKAAEKRRPWENLKRRFGRRTSTTWISNDGRAGGYFREIASSASLSIAAARSLFDPSPLTFDEAHESMLAGKPRSTVLGAEVTMKTSSRHSTEASSNVIGLVRGSDATLRDEYVVYTAHLDHLGVRKTGAGEDSIRNGMYDNAMGVALMLETARIIAAAPPKRSVMFIALTAEEKGLLGSDYFVNNPTAPIANVVANVNLDMPLFLQPLADLVAIGSEQSSIRPVAESAAHAEGFALSDNPFPEENLLVRSDHYSFMQRGIPAVFLISGLASLDGKGHRHGERLFRNHIENHYHKPSDDISRPVHWSSAVRFTRATARIGYEIANKEQRPVWQAGDD